MLARSANGLFWMSRYLERAEHAARLLFTQFEALEDRSVEEIDQSWRRIYLSIGRSPLGGHLTSNLENENFMLLDTFTLADDLTFESMNIDSIRSNMHFARENARQIRNVIGRDFWTRLNTAYLNLNQARIEHVWENQPKSFYLNTQDTTRTLSGNLDSTMYRDDGWHFLQLGRYIERTQIVVSLLKAHLEVFSLGFTDQDSSWISLLVLCNARLAYRREHSLLSLNPLHVLNFLVTDPAHPHSIRFAVDRTCEHHQAIISNQSQPAPSDLNASLNKMQQLISQDWQSDALTVDDFCHRLQRMLTLSQAFSDDLSAIYFFT